MQKIQTLDLTDWLVGGRRRISFIKAMESSMISTSFFNLQGHGIPDHLLDEVKASCVNFFDLPDGKRLKHEYASEGHQYGYTPFNIEKGDGAKFPDHKHFLQFGDLHPFIFTEDVYSLQLNVASLFYELREVYKTLLRPLALILKQQEEFLLKKEGNNIIRLIDYPERSEVVRYEGPSIEGGNAANLCAYRHRDINVLTLLWKVEKGLELEQGKKWIEIPVDPNSIVVNAGMLLEHLSNGYIKAGPHQVVCEANTRRFASPFFGHFLPRAYIDPLKGLNGRRNLKKYSHKYAHYYLMDVLVKIGLLKEVIPMEQVAGGKIIVEEGDSL